MTNKILPQLDNNEMGRLKEALLYLHVGELRKLCADFNLLDKGSKGALISRLLHFIKTGQEIKDPAFPKASMAQRGVPYPLHENTFMLKGAYKNDLKTRLFFKQLIGDHFHFTAFGIDWLNDRWLKGQPPTYQEFAQMWQNETEQRKKLGSTPKEEWAYINFTQRFSRAHPDTARKDVLAGWEKERTRQKAIVSELVIRIKPSA